MMSNHGQSSVEYLLAVSVLVFACVAIWSQPTVRDAFVRMRGELVHTIAEDAALRRGP